MPEFYSEDNQTNKSEDLISSEEIKHIQQTEETKNMEVHHHAHDPAAPSSKKLEKLFLGIFNAIPGSVLWVFSRVSIGT